MSMIYTYTWSHLLLLATMCGCTDTEDTVTDNWVAMLENQQKQMFPFTLWPLTYRTSTMIASPGMSSPSLIHISFGKETKNECNVTIKFYKSNEVLVICFQCPDKFQSTLLKQNSIVTVYDKVNLKTMKVLTKLQEENEDKDQDIKCIICTGYGMGATFATLMAHDLAKDFEEEAAFWESDTPRTTVDCVSFSMPEMGNEEYWREFDSLVDEHITVRHTEDVDIKFPKSCLFVGNKEKPVPTIKSIKGKHPIEPEKITRVPCERYMEDIDKKVSTLLF